MTAQGRSLAGIRTVALVANGLLFIAGLTTGCAARNSHRANNPPINNGDFIDLQPGWRLRVVTPLVKTGSDYRIKFREMSVSGNSITLGADEFQGYELSHYAVERRGVGVRVRFLSAEIVRDGVATRESRSVAPLFAAPARTRFVRLVYLTRASAADHNMAVIACAREEELEQLTRAAQANDVSCGKDPRCSWVPAGIAVRPEHQPAPGAEWRPVR